MRPGIKAEETPRAWRTACPLCLPLCQATCEARVGAGSLGAPLWQLELSPGLPDGQGCSGTGSAVCPGLAPGRGHTEDRLPDVRTAQPTATRLPDGPQGSNRVSPASLV